jgi:hypothetical protein
LVRRSLLSAVVGCFFGDLHVVNVAFANACGGDLARTRLCFACPQSWRNRSSPCWRGCRRPSGKRWTPPSPCRARGLQCLQAPVCRHSGCRWTVVLLEVAVGAALLHGANAAHAAVALVAAALVQNTSPGASSVPANMPPIITVDRHQLQWPWKCRRCSECRHLQSAAHLYRAGLWPRCQWR